ncbi:MAG: DNA polymerase III subunit beta [Firmicutes bacterium]|nr:DNA polymerase III subunit beta [Bacillota bacterium]
MKLILGGNDLSDAVSKVFKAVPSKTTNPILEGIKLSAFKNSLTLSATDTELSIEKTISADVKIEGEVVVPGKFFAEFVKKLNKEQIELSLDENNRLKIRYSDSEGTLQCQNAADFPKIATLEDGQYFIIIRSEFKDLINKTAFSVCQDDSRPILKGLLLEVDNVSLTGVALDGYRLAKCQKPIEKTTAMMSAVVPSRCINEIAKLIDDSADPLSVTIQKNYLRIDLDHTIITSRLLDGEYINYKQIIPSDFSSVITLPCDQFEWSLERAILLSRIDRNNLVKFDISQDTMVLSSNSDIGTVNEKLPVKLNGSDLSIAFNARYFMELLKYLGSDNLNIKFTGSVTPCIVEPCGTGEYLMYLILPVRII